MIEQDRVAGFEDRAHDVVAADAFADLARHRPFERGAPGAGLDQVEAPRHDVEAGRVDAAGRARQPDVDRPRSRPRKAPSWCHSVSLVAGQRRSVDFLNDNAGHSPNHVGEETPDPDLVYTIDDVEQGARRIAE